MRRWMILAGWLLATLLPTLAASQIIIIEPPRPPGIWPPHPPHPPIPPEPWPPVPPPPPQPPTEIIYHEFDWREFTADARIRGQVAEVQLSQTIANRSAGTIEAQYYFPVPEGSTIQDFVLLVDGQELPGKLMPKEEAQRIYEEIVRRRRDPALLELVGRGLLRTSVFPIPAGAERKLTLRLTQLLPAQDKLTEFRLPLPGAGKGALPAEVDRRGIRPRTPQRVAVRVRIEGDTPLRNIYSPTHEVKIERAGEREATVTWESPGTGAAGSKPTGSEFRLLFDRDAAPVGATLLSWWPDRAEDGYFMLLAAPEIRPTGAEPLSKTVVFAIDRSGSMGGKKIEQARGALKFVLNNLRPGDLFNIVTYDDRVETYKPELQRWDEAAREAALRYADNLQAGGSTNIDEALRSALGMVRDAQTPAYVLFLTDGLPTAGETNELKIADRARTANAGRARVFSFGVGYDVNARLLDRLSGGNSGTSEYVRPEEDIEATVSRFYAKLTAPVLSGIKLELAGTDVNRVYPRDLPDLFQGGQLIVTGRYREAGDTTVRLAGKTGGQERAYEYPARLASPGDPGDFGFIERLWATRRIGDLIDQIDLHGRSEELTKELVELSTRYGILTPYTAFLADDRVALHAAANAGVAGERLRRLDEVSGHGGLVQRAHKAAMSQASVAAPATAMPEALGIPAASADSAGASQFEMRSASGGAVTLSAPHAAGENVAVPGQAAGPRQVGDRTYYFKEGAWVDAALKPVEVSKAEPLEQFSEAYFALVAKLTPAEARQLSIGAPAVMRLGGKVYRLTPPAN